VRHFWLLAALAILAPACGSNHNNKPANTLPAAPTNLAFVSANSTSARIDLTWIDNSDNEFEFRIERSNDNGLTYAQVGVVPRNSQAYSDLGLSPGTTYLYRVAAWNSKGYSSYAGPLTVTTMSLAWNSPITGGPATGRADHTAIYDTSTVPPRMIVFGGFDVGGGGIFSNQVWSFTLPTVIPVNPWTLLATTTSPGTLTLPGLSAHSAIYDSLNQRMIVFGGQLIDSMSNLVLVNDVYILDLTTLVWTKPVVAGTPPSPRIHHQAVYDSFHQQMIVQGGYDGTFELADTHVLSMSGTTAFTWSGPLSTGPIKRQMHCAAYDPLRTRMVIFGGLDNDLTDGSPLNLDSWTFSTGVAGIWSPLLFPGTPGLRYGHTGIYDAANQRMVVFGGAEDSSFSPVLNQNLWGMNLFATPEWDFMPSTTGTAGRFSHTAIYDSAQRRMVIYGGYDAGMTPFSDAWVINM